DGRRGERTIDELLDGRWAVIGREDLLTDGDHRLLRSLDAVVIDDDGDFVVVRPDRIVFGIGRAALDALADVVNRYKLFG
ncbi:MAG: hypothetical protein ACO3Q0_03820, partial [Ilumatobacteraceae bacterium]